MPIIQDQSGEFQLMPQGIPVARIQEEILGGIPVSDIKVTLSIPEVEWHDISEHIRIAYRALLPPPTPDEQRLHINAALRPFALAIPPYFTSPELARVEAILAAGSPDETQLSGLICNAVMEPRMRVLQLQGRFQQLPPFTNVAYILDASALAYYRGNYVAAYMSLVPVIEGVLVRWFGGPLPHGQRFPRLRAFVQNLHIDHPCPRCPRFFDSWHEAASRIVNDYVFRPTNNHPPTSDPDFFNRHIALHLLEDTGFCTPVNVMRGFLLLDLLSELYIFGLRLPDPRWSVTHEEETRRVSAYSRAADSQFDANQPERLLS